MTDTFLFTNRHKKGDCIRRRGQPGNWDGILLEKCDKNMSEQKIVIEGDKMVMGQYAVTITPQNDVDGQLPLDVRYYDKGWSDANAWGRNNKFDFIGTKKNSSKSGIDAVRNGPFTISNKHYKDYNIDMDDDKRLRNKIDDTNRSEQHWLNYELFSECTTRKISFDDCTTDNLKDCNIDGNKKDFKVCPKEYCGVVANTGKKECRAWCNENEGKCDTVVIEYCKANPKDTEYCGCINTAKYDKLIADLGTAGTTMLPTCHIAECVSGKAYKLQNTKGIACPDQQICLQGIDLDSVGGSSSITGVSFNCNQESAAEVVENKDGSMEVKNSTGTIAAKTPLAEKLKTPKKKVDYDYDDDEKKVINPPPPLYFGMKFDMFIKVVGAIIGGIVLLLVVVMLK
jgi:hypothetical protein